MRSPLHILSLLLLLGPLAHVFSIPPPIVDVTKYPHGTVTLVDANETELAAGAEEDLPKWRVITQTMWYVSGCSDFFEALKYNAGHCYEYEPAPGSKQSYVLNCHDDGMGFLQTNYIDDGCQYVEKTFNVSTNQCVPGRQFPSIFQCAKD